MQASLLQLFRDHPQAAFFISLAISIGIALLGVVPSVFITAANLYFFGPVTGFLVSFLGEALGAVISFILYRKGFKKALTLPADKYPKLHRLAGAKGQEAFLAILALRLLPFVPSGLVTLAGAVGEVSLLTFAVASSIGKFPALLLEAYAVYQVGAFGWQGKLLLGLTAVLLLFLLLRRRKPY